MSRLVMNKMRSAVSGDRVRFGDSKYNLDLTYITKNLIAMAFPASGFEATYRNNLEEVSSMLNSYHGSNYMVWNLSGRQYDYTKFNDQVLEYYFPDHHSPPLNLLFMIIVSMDSWLSADPQNVAVVHCIGGKGRTGTVMACYLTYKGIFDDPKDALVYFGQARSTKERGVTQVSQVRYVDYFAQILYKGVRPHPNKLRIIKLMMSSVPCWKEKGCRPYFHFYDTNHTSRELLCTTKYSSETRFYDCADDPILWTMDTIIKGDILLKFYHLKLDQKKVYTKVVEGGGKKKYASSMFRASIHTAFVNLDTGCLSLAYKDLDIYKKPKRFVESLQKASFNIQIFFELVPDGPEDGDGEDVEVAATYHQFFQRRMDSREMSEKKELDDDIVKGILASMRNGQGDAGGGAKDDAGEEEPREGLDPGEEEREKEEKAEEGYGEPAGDEKEQKRRVRLSKRMSFRKASSADSSPIAAAEATRKYPSNTLLRPRLFSFRATKKNWEEREAGFYIPPQLEDADTDEDLEDTASEDEDTEGSKEEDASNNNNIGEEEENGVDWVRKDKEKEQEGEGGVELSKNLSADSLNVRVKKAHLLLHGDRNIRHSWGSAIGRRRGVSEDIPSSSADAAAGGIGRERDWSGGSEVLRERRELVAKEQTRYSRSRNNGPPRLSIGVAGSRKSEKIGAMMSRKELDDYLKDPSASDSASPSTAVGRDVRRIQPASQAIETTKAEQGTTDKNNNK